MRWCHNVSSRLTLFGTSFLLLFLRLLFLFFFWFIPVRSAFASHGRLEAKCNCSAWPMENSGDMQTCTHEWSLLYWQTHWHYYFYWNCGWCHRIVIVYLVSALLKLWSNWMGATNSRTSIIVVHDAYNSIYYTRMNKPNLGWAALRYFNLFICAYCWCRLMNENNFQNTSIKCDIYNYTNI